MRIAFFWAGGGGGGELDCMQSWRIIDFFIAIFCVAVASRLIWKIRVLITVQ